MTKEKNMSMAKNNKNLRSSNFELLRIIAILCIIVFHFSYEGGFSYPAFCFNEFVVYSFHMLGELGVNLFILISGYHMIKGTFKWKKLLTLILEVQFYNWICVFLSIRFNGLVLDKRTFFTNFFPVTEYKYWFITAYILIYLFSPYINKLLLSLSKKELQNLLTICLILFCIIPTFYGGLKNDTETLLYYNRFIWLMIIYMIGAYIRLYPPVRLVKKSQWLGISFLLFCFMEASILIIEKFPAFFAEIGITEGNYFWRPNNLPMTALSISIFLLFRLIDIKPNKLINRLASTTLGIYLLHDGQMNYYLWQVWLKSGEYAFSRRLVLYIPLCALMIFLFCAVMDLLRQLLFYLCHSLFKKLNE